MIELFITTNKTYEAVFKRYNISTDLEFVNLKASPESELKNSTWEYLVYKKNVRTYTEYSNHININKNYELSLEEMKAFHFI